MFQFELMAITSEFKVKLRYNEITKLHILILGF